MAKLNVKCEKCGYSFSEKGSFNRLRINYKSYLFWKEVCPNCGAVLKASIVFDQLKEKKSQRRYFLFCKIYKSLRECYTRGYIGGIKHWKGIADWELVQSTVRRDELFSAALLIEGEEVNDKLRGLIKKNRGKKVTIRVAYIDIGKKEIDYRNSKEITLTFTEFLFYIACELFDYLIINSKVEEALSILRGALSKKTFSNKNNLEISITKAFYDFSKLYAPEAVKFLRRFLDLDKYSIILDLGCGVCLITAELAKVSGVRKVVGIDSEKNSIATGRKVTAGLKDKVFLEVGNFLTMEINETLKKYLKRKSVDLIIFVKSLRAVPPSIQYEREWLVAVKGILDNFLNKRGHVLIIETDKLFRKEDFIFIFEALGLRVVKHGLFEDAEGREFALLFETAQK
ncbi:TPA: methyltransferase domain-containing protein [archaeon]|uniref:Methyltransferase domain-containing protein n=1 Tax=Candidatus Naiadarchaeum limnaeum TaxID=2756139 RepID=A0A832URV7_9ARCH|nr:methyltransferase domain-containing protein [Candidatus Naiadarchaeum limnaeum]